MQTSHLTYQKLYYCLQWVKSWNLYNKHKNTQDFTFLVGSGISKGFGWVSSDSFCSKSVASVANQWRNTKNLRKNQSIQQRKNLKLVTHTTKFQKNSNPQYPTTQTSQFRPQSQHRKKLKQILAKNSSIQKPHHAAITNQQAEHQTLKDQSPKIRFRNEYATDPISDSPEQIKKANTRYKLHKIIRIRSAGLATVAIWNQARDLVLLAWQKRETGSPKSESKSRV